MKRRGEKPIRPVLSIQSHGEQTSTGCPLVNIHLVDASEAGRDTFLSGVRVLGPVANRWAELLCTLGVVIERDRLLEQPATVETRKQRGAAKGVAS